MDTSGDLFSSRISPVLKHTSPYTADPVAADRPAADRALSPHQSASPRPSGADNRPTRPLTPAEAAEKMIHSMSKEDQHDEPLPK